MSKEFLILNISVLSFTPKTLDYIAGDNINISALKPGIKLLVPFKNKKAIGILITVKKNSDIAKNKLKYVKEIIDDIPLVTLDILNLCLWAQDYYSYFLAEILKSAIPKLARQNNKIEFNTNEKQINNPLKINEKLNLNDEQQKAFALILNSLNKFNCFVLNGVTGSGKTEIYLQIIEEVIKIGKQALILVPEISLTPQIVSRFEKRFNFAIAQIHSNLTDKERFTMWVKIKNSIYPVIIGTRSAIFTPCQNIGIIIIDEEHDLSFKQQSGFKYSARDLAIIRAKNNNIPIVLGSATPSIETLFNIEKNKYIELNLSFRANNSVQPKLKIIDMRQEKITYGISNQLLLKITEHLANKNQILLFINRRGYAPILMCYGCGNIIKCKCCDIALTYHINPEYLCCHYCNSKKEVNLTCNTCNKQSMQPLGIAIEKIMQGLKKLFPDIKSVQIDSDNKKSLYENLLKINNNEVQILVGTQMIAKGHHFPNITLVGIINADSGFFNTDFRATEKFGQLLLQVAGRAGREDKKGEVFIQTYNPENQYLLDLIKNGYKNFAEKILAERKNINLPPYSYLTIIMAEAIQKEKCELFLNTIKNQIATNTQIKAFGPMIAPITKKQGRYRYQLLLQTNYRKIMQNTVKYIYGEMINIKTSKYIRWSIDVDPKDLS